MSRLLPTTDLYFVNSCGDLVRRWWRAGPVTQLGANCFLAGETLFLIRHDDDALMQRALDWPGRFVYLIDDDIAAATDSPFLPADYRRRLIEFAAGFHTAMLRRADVILVPSRPLAALFEADERIEAKLIELTPYWPICLAGQQHFAGLDGGSPVDVIHLGSGSHAGGLEALAPIVAQLLDQRDDFTFTYIGKQPLDALNRRDRRVTRVAPMSWSRYQNWIVKQRYHLAVYPLDPGRFDRARSSNKLIEHAVIGAVGMYPEDWGPALELGSAALLGPSAPEAWGEKIIQALNRRSTLARMATRAAKIIGRQNDRAKQRYLLLDILGIETA